MKDESRRRFLHSSLALAGLALLSGCSLVSLPRTEPKRAARLGFLDSTSPQVTALNLDAFRQGMRAQGYEEGQDYVLESRYSEGRSERLPDLAAELVSLPVDVVLASTLIANLAAKNATSTIPIVMTNIGSDPVAFGVVDSLARPGGNVTGIANLGVLLTGKRVELLKQILPALTRLAIFQEASASTENVTAAQPVASALGIQLQVVSVRNADDLDAAFETAIREHAEALLLVPGSTFYQLNRTRIIKLAAQHRLPASYSQRQWADEGGLIAYAPDQATAYRNVATFVSKILKGARPADLPVELATTFDFIINLKTALALGLAVPKSVLQQATEVIQ